MLSKHNEFIFLIPFKRNLKIINTGNQISLKVISYNNFVILIPPVNI